MSPENIVFVAHATDNEAEMYQMLAAIKQRWKGFVDVFSSETQAHGKLEYLACIQARSTEAGRAICYFAEGYAAAMKERKR